MRMLILCAALALAACGQQKSKSESVGADEPGAAIPTPTESAPRTFEAISRTAEAFTGALTLIAVSPEAPNDAPSLKITGAQGQSYTTDLIESTTGAGAIGAEAWTALLPIPDTADVQVHAVQSQAVTPAAPNGGLCGKDHNVTTLAVAEFKNAMGENELQLAAFSDPVWPPKSAPQLCGTYTYIEQAAASAATATGAP